MLDLRDYFSCLKEPDDNKQSMNIRYSDNKSMIDNNIYNNIF